MRGGAGVALLSPSFPLPLTLLRPASQASLPSPRKRGGGKIAHVLLYVAPLWPAGHLPLRWGDHAVTTAFANLLPRKVSQTGDAANLPT
ncbi:hypothetical protein J2X13_004797 [Aminobacter aminovorans]|nr:hypothetical protein [Aminobacter aminovorans]